MAHTKEEIEEEIRFLEQGHGSLPLNSGSPDTEALRSCSEMMLDASKNLLLSDDVHINGMFKYGDRNGDKDFRQGLAKFLTQEYGDPVKSSDLMLTAAATHGLHLILSLLCDRSSIVFVEDPTYFWGFRIANDDLQMKIVPVPCDSDGIDVDAFDQLITQHKSTANFNIPSTRYWAAAYLIPVFSNPVGFAYPQDRSNKMVQLARKHDVLLIAEDVYNLLHYSGKEHGPPRLLSFDKKSDPDYGRGHVISNATFSKILAPGLRLGWIEGSAPMLKSLNESNFCMSGGSCNHYTSKLVAAVLKSGALNQHIKWLRKTYKARRDAMCQTLDEYLPKSCSYQKPKGGFFVWLRMREDVDTMKLRKFAYEKYDLTFLPGICTSPTGGCNNCVRLSFSSCGEDKIREGAKKFCMAYQEFLDASK